MERSDQLSGAKILIVEDEPHIAESLSFILRRAEFDVDLVTDGTEALARLRREAYAAIVLDIMLPGMNGLEVLKAIRSDTQLSGLPVIVLTAKGQANDRKSAEAIGASAFITKPYSNAEVVERIRELVGA
jgi:DNA-binding response OmpR family regulator